MFLVVKSIPSLHWRSLATLYAPTMSTLHSGFPQDDGTPSDCSETTKTPDSSEHQSCSCAGLDLGTHPQETDWSLASTKVGEISPLHPK